MLCQNDKVCHCRVLIHLKVVNKDVQIVRWFVITLVRVTGNLIVLQPETQPRLRLMPILYHPRKVKVCNIEFSSTYVLAINVNHH